MVREKEGIFDYQSGKSQGKVREKSGKFDSRFGYEPCHRARNKRAEGSGLVNCKYWQYLVSMHIASQKVLPPYNNEGGKR